VCESIGSKWGCLEEIARLPLRSFSNASTFLRNPTRSSCTAQTSLQTASTAPIDFSTSPPSTSSKSPRNSSGLEKFTRALLFSPSLSLLLLELKQAISSFHTVPLTRNGKLTRLVICPLLLTSCLISQSLLSLPPELLSDIFHLAHRDTFEDDPDPEEPEHDTSLTRDPICRTLLFFQREALFREVTGLSLDQFKLFVRTIVDNSQLGEFVRVLAAPWNVAGLKNSKEETKALLTNLSHVETLRIT